MIWAQNKLFIWLRFSGPTDSVRRLQTKATILSTSTNIFTWSHRGKWRRRQGNKYQNQGYEKRRNREPKRYFIFKIYWLRFTPLKMHLLKIEILTTIFSSFIHLIPEIWTPLKDADSKSPCACGCIYIVSGMKRTTTITSSEHCYSLPIIWKVKVIFTFKL